MALAAGSLADTSKACSVKSEKPLLVPQRGLNILLNCEFKPENTEESCPCHQIEWQECWYNVGEPNSYRKAACNCSDGKDVQNQNSREGLSYEPNTSEELQN